MRKEAQEYRAQLLKDIETSAKGGAKGGSGKGGAAASSHSSAGVRTKLVNAITVMQEGLVERESEVSRNDQLNTC